MLALNWVVMHAPQKDFLLGDAGVNFVSGDILDGARVALSCECALFIVRSLNPSKGIRFDEAQSHEVENLIAESAARANRWLIGASEPVVTRWQRQVAPAE